MRYDIKQITRARLARGWTGKDLADAAKLAPSTVYAVENDGPQTPGTIKALATALKLNLADLVVDDDSREEATA